MTPATEAPVYLVETTPATKPDNCPTCGDPANMFCSDGFHAPGKTYWPAEAPDLVERLNSIEHMAPNNDWLLNEGLWHTATLWQMLPEIIAALAAIPSPGAQSEYERGYFDGEAKWAEAVSQMQETEEALRAQLATQAAETHALQAFKDYVHQRLDDAGIPTHPEGLHSAAGCRVGDRLDIALAQAVEIERLRKRLEVVEGWSEDADGIACRDATIKLLDDKCDTLRAQLAAKDQEIERLKSQPQNTAEMPEIAAMRYIEQLRSGIGASVTILCDNDDATYKEQSVAIEACADWTDWENRRFYGESVLQCLAKAVIARANALRASTG